MTDKPILFSGPMVRALLEGRKTQTRRVLKKPTWAQDAGWPEKIMNEQELSGRLVWYAKETGCLAKLPLYQPGDRLWVREAWRTWKHLDKFPPRNLDHPLDRIVQYEADGTLSAKVHPRIVPGRFRQGMHMPRWASRLTLTVTDVRVQRVQEISADDAIAEGTNHADGLQYLNCYGPSGCPTDEDRSCNKHGCWGVREDFRTLWDSLNASRGFGWKENPWVAAYSFTVEKRNIDQ